MKAPGAEVVSGGVNRRNLQKYLNPHPLHRWLLGRFQEQLLHLLKLLFNAEGEKAIPRLLDVGCGEGFILEFLCQRMPGVRYFGSDTDEVALEQARERNHGVLFQQADVLHLPFGDASFDIVLCLEVLEHVPEPWIALKEMKRVSTRYLLISVPNQPYFSLANLLRGKNWCTRGDDPEHVHHWVGSHFVALLKREIRILKVVYPFPWVMVLGVVDTE